MSPSCERAKHLGKTSGSRSALALLVAALLPGLVHCGGSSDTPPAKSDQTGPHCAAVESCGGNLAGNWSVKSLCADVRGTSLASTEAQLPEDCRPEFEDAITRATIDSKSSSIEFTTDGHFTERGSMTISLTVQFASTCLNELGAPPTDSGCRIVQDGFITDAKADSALCHHTADTCECVVTKISPFNGFGDYHTQSSTFFFGQDTQGAPYCVRGNSASLQTHNEHGLGRMDLVR